MATEKLCVLGKEGVAKDKKGDAEHLYRAARWDATKGCLGGINLTLASGKPLKLRDVVHASYVSAQRYKYQKHA